MKSCAAWWAVKGEAPECTARTLLVAADGGPSVPGLCNLSPVISRHPVWRGPGFRWREAIYKVLSYSAPERSSEVWEEASTSASASLSSQLSFTEGVSFSKPEIHRGGALGLLTAPFSRSFSSHLTPWRSVQPLESPCSFGLGLSLRWNVGLWHSPQRECQECRAADVRGCSGAGSSWQPRNSRCFCMAP